MPTKPISVKQAQSWVKEAQNGQRDWRADSWIDEAFYDGEQWSEDDLALAEKSGVDPITINRIFPSVNMVVGNQAINRLDVTAKARTQKDGTVAQTMTEAVKFVMDQNEGEFCISNAFSRAAVAGIGWLGTGFNRDPRKERLSIFEVDWKEVWWDPFCGPWMTPETCRYFFMQRWMDLDQLKGMFPEKEKELKEHYDELTGSMEGMGNLPMDDPSEERETQKRMAGGINWVDSKRTRVRPVEMWYPVISNGLFALFADGRCIEIAEDADPAHLVQLLNQRPEIVRTPVHRMRRLTFLGNLILEDTPSPFKHDQFPYVPWVGYLNRLDEPYGVPRQIRGPQIDVNKRRAMSLAYLRKRRVIAEEGAAKDMQALYDEAQSIDGFMVVNKDKNNVPKRFEVLDQHSLAMAELSMKGASDSEMQQISGANAETLGYQSNADSGKAIQLRQAQGNIVLAKIFDNHRRSIHRLGELIVSNIQNTWKREKILRVTDSLTQAERYVTVNEIVRKNDGSIVMQNNITQGRYDVVVADSPQTDTVREQNMNLIIEWVKKSPPEIIPHLMGTAMEMSNLPNKEQLLSKLRPLLGALPGEAEMSPEELKEAVLQQMEEEKQVQATANELSMKEKQLELEGLALENRMTAAKAMEKEVEIAQKQAEFDERFAQLEAVARKLEQVAAHINMQKGLLHEQAGIPPIQTQTGPTF